METKQKIRDLAIIGASAAGCSAAVYAARRGLDFLLISKNVGGEVALSGEVENWPGMIKTSGVELAKNFSDHIKHYNTEIHDQTEVSAIKQIENYHQLILKKNDGAEEIILTKTVIIASGIHPRSLAVTGEKELRGVGITYCTVCDGPLFRGKITTTIGAGNAALESALMMNGIAQKVFLITKYPDTPETNHGFPKGEKILVEKTRKSPNVSIIHNADVIEFIGQNKLESIKYKDKTTGEESLIQTQAAMVHIGMLPNSSFVDCVKKNPVQEIEIDTKCRTSCPGIYAAGDVTNIPFKQIVIAAGQGAVAALSAIEYINRW